MKWESQVLQRIRDQVSRLGCELSDPYLAISVPQQTCTLFKSNLAHRTYAVSTSRNPPSCRENSFGTPGGLHRIARKIGGDQPVGMVFRGRIPTGQCFHTLSAEENCSNLITSRILWLEGLEPGINAGPGVDSFQRYIYLHGTNHEERLGQPFSGGCIEFSNTDIIGLYEIVTVGTLVWIDTETRLPSPPE